MVCQLNRPPSAGRWFQVLLSHPVQEDAQADGSHAQTKHQRNPETLRCHRLGGQTRQPARRQSQQAAQWQRNPQKANM